MLPVRNIALPLAVAIAGYSGVGAAQNIDFRDRTFEIGTVLNFQDRDLISQTDYTADPFKTSLWIEAVNGKLAWIANLYGCSISLVYLPGRSNSGTVDCKPQRQGTDSNWRESSSTASFQTTTTVEGNVVTLHGQLKGTRLERANFCGLHSEEHVQFEVSQTLKLRINGNTCQVLALEEVDSDEQTGTVVADPIHHVRRTTVTASGSCKLSRRSAQTPGDRTPPFDMSCQ